MPKAKPNFRKIAALAGVSLSTVDRVLNGRGGVSDSRHQKVVTAARSLGVERILPQAVRGSLHFDVIRTQDDHGTDYYQRLEQALMRVPRMLKTSIRLHRSTWPSEDLQELVQFIKVPRYRRHGLIIITRDADEIRQAIMGADLQQMPVVLMNSPMSGVDEIPYVGIDNGAAGRCAALMMGGFARQNGRVLLLTGSRTYTAHRQRAEGFISVLRRDHPHLELDGPYDVNDEPELARLVVARSLQAPGAPLVGIYNSGSAASGIDAALQRVPAGALPFWITHEATRPHIELMRRGRIQLLIDQDPEAQALSAMQYLTHRHGESDAPTRLQPIFYLVTRENLALHDNGP